MVFYYFETVVNKIETKQADMFFFSLQEATKRIFEDNLAHWCSSEKCDLKIFQENSNVLMTSSDGN